MFPGSFRVFFGFLFGFSGLGFSYVASVGAVSGVNRLDNFACCATSPPRIAINDQSAGKKHRYGELSWAFPEREEEARGALRGREKEGGLRMGRSDAWHDNSGAHDTRGGVIAGARGPET